MFRMWGKIFKDNRMIQDSVICDDSGKRRTQKVLDALGELCTQFDLSAPIWLEKTVADFKRHDKARFYADSFIDSVEFDYLEIHVIEEDSW
ncbi:MAG: hypothetical protein J6P60_05185 [Lachnospiraceae bacterium]|nr:hypothetical protein [Lachnospiraceae bacterium]